MVEKKNLHPETAYNRIISAIREIDPKIVSVLDRKDALSAIDDACYEVLWQDWMGEDE
ncbi:hypothetical protein [Cronobacter phage EspYZU12]|nr:hypothetical protein EspYZU15_225 [Cronobacter phage EspYZU15]WAK45634.1 hypothetical protein EspYZU14_230 [Cronobacter phage EspYZU14]WBF78418.1 hypothetical protein [Cronobacter phage EspYZU12]